MVMLPVSLLYVLLMRYPCLQYDWALLSRNPAMTFKIARWFLHRDDLDWDAISAKEGVELAVVLRERRRPWNWDILSANEAIRIEDILSNWKVVSKRLDWNWDEISKRSDLKLEDVYLNSDLPWDWHAISSTLRVHLWFVASDVGLGWDWLALSSRCKLNYDSFMRHPCLSWNADHLSLNDSVTYEIVVSNLGFEWNWITLSKHMQVDVVAFKRDRSLTMSLPWSWSALTLNSSLSIDEILEDMWCSCSLPWDVVALQSRTDLTYDHLATMVRRLDVDVDSFTLSRNLTIDARMIELVSDYHVDWRTLSFNKDVPLAVLARHIEQDWDWASISYVNENVTFSFVATHRHVAWNWAVLSQRDDVDIGTVVELQDKGWSWPYLSVNLGLRWADIDAHRSLPWTYHIALRRDIDWCSALTWMPSCVEAKSYWPGLTIKCIVNDRSHPWKWDMVLSEAVCDDERTRLMRMTLHRMLHITRERVRYRRELFAPVIDMYRLRLRDIKLGVATSLVRKPRSMMLH